MSCPSEPQTDLADALQTLYAQVPATRCAGSGECCQLTDEEYAGRWATMFPLYRAEYLHIVAFVDAQFTGDRRGELLEFTEERPRRCPFLDADCRCTVYPARPLICRTYGVMSAATVAAAVAARAGTVPDRWLRAFARREGGMACPRVCVVEPDKVDRHVDNLIDFAYEQELVRLSESVELASPERQALFAGVTGRTRFPVRWSWGGFNAVRHAPLDWLRERFAEYWGGAELADAG